MPWHGAVVRDTDCGHHQRGIQRWHASPTAARNVPGHTCTHTLMHIHCLQHSKKAEMHTQALTLNYKTKLYVFPGGIMRPIVCLSMVI